MYSQYNRLTQGKTSVFISHRLSSTRFCDRVIFLEDGACLLYTSYPMFVKPAGTGSSVGVSKVTCREELSAALDRAAQYDRKILVEEFIRGREIEVAVMGNDSPVASICGEIDSGAEFYDYEAKYVTDTSQAYIPARISEETEEAVRDAAVRIYQAIGCQGLSRVDFFVTYEGEEMCIRDMYPAMHRRSITRKEDSIVCVTGIPPKTGRTK